MSEENGAVNSTIWVLITLLIIAIIIAALYFSDVFANHNQSDIKAKTPVSVKKPD